MPTSAQVPRVEIFLDHSNFYNGLRQQFGDGRVDFVRLVDRVVGQRTLTCFNIYTGTVNEGREPAKASAQQRFFRVIQHLSFPTRHFTHPLKYYASWPQVPPQEKAVDARIVQDLIMGAVDHTYDVAVLLSGDQDFCEVVTLLKTRFDVQLETYYPMSRRHLYEARKSCFMRAEVITKKFYNNIR